MARFRPDPELVAEENEIVDNELDAVMYPTVEAGIVDPAWFAGRRAAQAKVSGSCYDANLLNNGPRS